MEQTLAMYPGSDTEIIEEDQGQNPLLVGFLSCQTNQLVEHDDHPPIYDANIPNLPRADTSAWL